jgi:acyl dehydratase
MLPCSIAPRFLSAKIAAPKRDRSDSTRLGSLLCGYAIIAAARSAVKTYRNPAELQALVGSPIGTSDWLIIDQPRIDQFAAVTGDDQWIHVDPMRAAAGMFGGTVAHGFLTLSLLPFFIRSSHKVEGARMSVNYGLNRVRFPAPVPVNSRLRAHFKLLSFEPIEGGVQVITEVTVEREGHAKPVCIAESVGRLYT